MKCHQCERPAFYELEGRIRVCLDCYYKINQIHNIQFLQNAAMANQALDDMDMISGMRTVGGRVPIAALAAATRGADRTVYNNIKISQSTVGVINTGDLAKIDAVITLTKETDAEQIGVYLQELTQVILDSQKSTIADRQELIDLIKSLAEQIQSARKKSVTLSLLKGIEERIQTISAAIPVYEKMKPIVEALYSNLIS
jgi:hypothetical protein